MEVGTFGLDSLIPGNSMTRSQLIAILAAENRHLHRRDLGRAVTAMLEQMAATLANSGRVQLHGFGNFSVSKRAAKEGRNPKTGEQVQVKAKTVPVFKSSKDLRARVNSSKAS